MSGRDSVVGVATRYGLDGPGIESRWRGEIFRICPDRPWGQLSLLYNGYEVFPRGKERPSRDADPSPLLVPWSWKGRAIPLLPLWTVRRVQNLSACTRVTFTFLLTRSRRRSTIPQLMLFPEEWNRGIGRNVVPREMDDRQCHKYRWNIFFNICGSEHHAL